MSVKKVITDFVAGRDFITAVEVAGFLVQRAVEELHVEIPVESAIAGPLLRRGASSYARDVIKKPRVVEELLNGDDEDQGELFEEYSEMVWIGRDEGGENLFGRRRALTMEQYQRALDLLRSKDVELRKKIDRYQDDFDRARAHWMNGMVFGQAVSIADHHHRARFVRA